MSRPVPVDPRRPGRPGEEPKTTCSVPPDPERPERPDQAVHSAKLRILGFCRHQLELLSPADIIDALMDAAQEYKRAQRRHQGSRRPNKSRASEEHGFRNNG